jgi:D-sedoheptulose 7-phosphate isomerase
MTNIVERAVVSRAAAERFAATNAVAERFFGDHADAIAGACHAMADRFQRGGRLFVCGDGAQRSDVNHVVVEFLHPVVVGKRALPALSLPAIEGGAARDVLGAMARNGDLLMLLSAGALHHSARAVLEGARARGLLTIALAGGSASAAEADHHFAVPSADACIVQETHELLYHVLWELVHVFFEHRATST